MSAQGPIEKRINDAKAKLESENLNEMVHEVFSVNASKINNQGLDAQVDTLIHWCGEEETATILEDIVRELEDMKGQGGMKAEDLDEMQCEAILGTMGHGHRKCLIG